MTTVAILAEPPEEGLALPSFSPTPLSAEEALALYRAMLADVTTAVEASGGETLLNYRSADDLPDGAGTTDVEGSIRAVVDDALTAPDDVRFEPQIGSSFYARVGNTITHLLEREGTHTAAVVEPTAPFLTRSVIDSAAMKLRSSDVVLGPTTDGRVYYAGFAEPVDFTEVFEPPAVETLTGRAREEGLSVDFLPMQPVIGRPDDLLTAIPAIRSRRTAERVVPQRTAAVLEELGLHVAERDDETTLVRD